MIPTLLDVPFDHYQRYGAAAHLLKALDLATPRVLEVGANRQRLLGQFLPHASFLYTDLHAEGDEKDFVVADATALPFPDQGFDAVVSLDVLEHIPVPLRTKAAAEMARVAGRAVIVGFPPDQPWVRDAEVDANSRWYELFGEDYVWLQEHKEFGLVDTAEIVAAFEAEGLIVLRFGQGDATLWSSLMGAHFIKVKFPELESLVCAADRLYNSRVFAGDHSDQPYREYCVAVRLEADGARLRANPPFDAKRDEEATALLGGLAASLRDIAVRTANSEREWDATARLLDAYIADLDVAKREWGSTAAYAQQLQAVKDASDSQWLVQEAELLQRVAEEQQRVAEVQQRVEYEQQRVADEQQRSLEAQRSAQSRIDALVEEGEAARIQFQEVERGLEEQLEHRATAYARSRKKWKVAMVLLAAGGATAGFLLGWGVF